ncbi:hypothetical protein ACFL1B_06465, partial [Nanoarchaeota archaeon]
GAANRSKKSESDFEELSDPLRNLEVIFTCRPQNLQVYHFLVAASADVVRQYIGIVQHVYADSHSMENPPVSWSSTGVQVLEDSNRDRQSYMRLKAELGNSHDRQVLGLMTEVFRMREPLSLVLKHYHHILVEDEEVQLAPDCRDALEARHQEIVEKIDRTGLVQVRGILCFDTSYVGSSGLHPDKGPGYSTMDRHVKVQAARIVQ